MSRRSMYAITAAAAVLVVGLLAAGGYFLYRTTLAEPDDYQVTLSTVPHDATVTINGSEPIDHPGGENTYTLSRNHAEITVDREEFDAATVTADLDADQPTEVEVELTPQTEEADAIYREDAGVYDEEAEATGDALDAAEELYDENEVIQLMPHEDETFCAYQGVSEEGGEFAVHLYLIEGNETQGRADFNEWLEDNDINSNQLEVVEHIEAGDIGQLDADAPESLEAIQEEEPADVDGFAPDPAGLSPDELVAEFLRVANTHDGSQDYSTVTALTRAEPLTTMEIDEPENPMNYPWWWDAMDAEAIAYPWIESVSTTETDDGINYEARVCIAFVPDDGSEVFLIPPRTWDLIVTEDNEDYIISGIDYQDAYHGDDTEAGPCGRSIGLP